VPDFIVAIDFLADSNRAPGSASHLTWFGWRRAHGPISWRSGRSALSPRTKVRNGG